METDRIEKSILLRAPRERVWRALTDSKEFGVWFGVKFDEPFIPGATLRGALVGTSVDAEVAKMQQQYRHIPFEITIERLEPQTRFSFRWHPAAHERGVDYSSEPTTLIVFELKDAPEGILLTVTESGFDRLPPERRVKAFSSNEQGWGVVVQLIRKYLENAQ
jgi:uncharacterized protein YndB with AHSA1/START domain